MFYYYSGMARPIVQETVIIERTIAQFPRGEGTWGSPQGQLGGRGSRGKYGQEPYLVSMERNR